MTAPAAEGKQRTGDSRSRRAWLPWTVLLMGLASVILLLGTDFVRQRAEVADLARIGAVRQIEVDIAVTHLWLEEHVTGDRVDLSEIDRRLERSLSLTRAMLGTAEASAPSRLLPLEDGDLKRKAEALEDWLLTFQAISRDRLAGYERGLDVGIGSPEDVSYDDVFAEVFAQTVRLAEMLDQRMARNQARSRRVFYGAVGAWSVVIAMAAFALWFHERRRYQAELDLRRSREQLLQSQKMEAVGRLAGGLAHDLNNYLAAIRGHCELVSRKQPTGDTLVVKMDRVVGIVNKAATLIGRLQTFGHRQPPHDALVSLGAVAESMATMIAPTLGEHIRLVRELPSEPWLVSADPTQLEQLLVNLLVNARDALPQGGEIEVRVANIAAGSGRRDWVRLTVSDNGVGIPEEIRDKVFEPFVSTKSTAGGGHSGLGLAIVYNIIDQHGGSIEVVSEEGSGTSFHVLLPRAEGRSADGPADKDPLGDRVAYGDERGDERILLVDDDDDFRESTQALLADLGYQVWAAGDGAEALKICAQEAYGFDLVLTDVVMPGLGGRELVDRIRRHADVKVIFMSGHSERMLSRYGVDRGEVQVLKNVLSGEALARRIRALLDDHSDPSLPG